MDESLLKFPCKISVKAMGLTSVEFEKAVLSIMHQHVPDLTEGAFQSRASKDQKYTSITITFTAESKEQLDAIYKDLTECELVVMAL